MTEAFFATPDEFRAWLGEHGTTADEVWVRMARKGSGIASIDWVQGVECALCFGWIDGKRIKDPTRTTSASASRRGARARSGPRSTARRSRRLSTRA